MKQSSLHPAFWYLYAGLVFLVAFGLYWRTLAPTVSFFDSGELVSAAYTFGVAHPPGYPLYVLLGWCFSKLPIGAGAYRLNLMSAFFGALAAVTVYGIVMTLLTSGRHAVNAPDGPADFRPNLLFAPVAAMSAAWLFAFSTTHWQHAIIAEVYSLNAFLCGLLFWLVARWRALALRDREQPRPDSPQRGGSFSPLLRRGAGGEVFPQNVAARQRGWRYLAAGALVLGLGMGNHQSIALFAVGACLLVALTQWRLLLDWRRMAVIVAALFLGLSIYVLTPIQAAHNPPINWGNPVTWKQFAWVVTRAGYATVERGNAIQSFRDEVFGNGGDGKSEAEADGSISAAAAADARSSLWERVRASLLWQQIATCNVLEEFGPLLAAMAVTGLAVALVLQWRLAVALLATLAVTLGGLIVISDPPPDNLFLVKEFHTPFYLMTAVCIGLGFAAVARGAFWLAGAYRAAQYALLFGLCAAVLLPSGLQVKANLTSVDRSRNYVAYDYAANALLSLEEHAILFTWGDSGAFPLWYLQIVEGRRPDVTLIHVPHLASDWYVEWLPQELFGDQPRRYADDETGVFGLLDQLIEQNQAARPIYFDYSSSTSLLPPYPLLPAGMAFKVRMPNDRLNSNLWPRYELRSLVNFILTDASLEGLRGEKMPDALLEKLRPLLGRRFTREGDLIEALIQQIGREAAKQYEALVFAYTLVRPRIAMDSDIERTFTMYGAARVELGNYFLDMGNVERASRHFNAAVRFDPNLGETIMQLLNYRESVYGSHAPAAESPGEDAP